jgi:hypothetical protein
MDNYTGYAPVFYHGKAKNQAAWSVFIFRVIFNNLTIGDCFLEILDADMTNKALVNSMTGELNLPLHNFLENFFKHCLMINSNFYLLLFVTLLDRLPEVRAESKSLPQP